MVSAVGSTSAAHPESDSAPGWRVGAEESAPATVHFSVAQWELRERTGGRSTSPRKVRRTFLVAPVKWEKVAGDYPSSCVRRERLPRRECRVQACLDRGREIRCVIIPTPPLVVEEEHNIAPTRLVFGGAPGIGDVGGDAGAWMVGVWFGVGGSGDAAFPGASLSTGAT